jgi:hypothetical protein
MMPSDGPRDGRMTFFEGARLIVGDGTGPVEGAGILVRDGRVAAAGPDIRAGEGDPRVDLAGKTVMPAIVNPHGHIGYFKDAAAARENFSRENVLDHLRRLAYYGVSVFQSLGTDREDIELGIRDEQRAGTLDDPELALLLSAGNGLVAPTPGSDNGGPYFATDVIREVSTPAQARAAVRELVAKNPDVIKFWVDDRNGEKRKFGPEVYSAIIDEAHQHGKKAIAHIYQLEDAKGVVRAGADGTAHMVRSPGPDQELLRLLTDNDVFVFTSMSIQKAAIEDPAWFDDPYLAQTVDQASRDALRAQLGQMPEQMATAMKAGYGILEAGLRAYLQAGVRCCSRRTPACSPSSPGSRSIASWKRWSPPACRRSMPSPRRRCWWSSRRWAPGWYPGRGNCWTRSTTSSARSAGRPAAIRTSCWEPAPSRQR